MTNDLADRTCAPCRGEGVPLIRSEVAAYLAQLHDDWRLAEDGKSIRRKFTFEGFAKPVYLANLAAFQADRDGHHPDIAFGWGYCSLTFTSHALGGLSENDFICAAKIDRATA